MQQEGRKVGRFEDGTEQSSGLSSKCIARWAPGLLESAIVLETALRA